MVGKHMPGSCSYLAVLIAAIVFVLAGWTTTSATAADDPPDIKRAKAEPAEVRVVGDTVYYTGNLSKASSAAFDAAVAGLARGQVTRLVISSGGGDTVAGRHVGRWVWSMGLVVEVDAICFSSCADYIFPAGRARVIRTDAFVGWHGNERQFAVLAARRGVSLADELRRFVPKELSAEQQAVFYREISDSLKVTQVDETQFYAQLGLNDAFAVCAVGDELEKRFGFKERKGWGFSTEDMALLGMTNTVYLGSGKYETDSTRFRKYLAQISAADCLALLK